MQISQFQDEFAIEHYWGKFPGTYTTSYGDDNQQLAVLFFKRGKGSNEFDCYTVTKKCTLDREVWEAIQHAVALFRIWMSPATVQIHFPYDPNSLEKTKPFRQHQAFKKT